MIIVSGEPRSGTSVMMLILRELWFTIAGEKWLGNPDDNPTGIWEIPKVVRNGISEDIVKGKCPSICGPINADVIKLTTLGLTSSADALIDKVIYMVREPSEVILSQLRLGHGEEQELSDNYNKNIMTFLLWASDKEHEVIVVSYNNLIVNPAWQISKVARFLQCFTHEGVERASKVVDPQYYRERR